MVPRLRQAGRIDSEMAVSVLTLSPTMRTAQITLSLPHLCSLI